MHQQGIGRGKVTTNLSHRHWRQKSYVVQYLFRSQLLQAFRLYATAEEYEYQTWSSFLQLLSGIQHRIQRLGLAQIASEQDSELVIARKARRHTSLRRSKRVFGAPIVNDLNLSFRYATLNQQALEPRRQNDQLIYVPVHPVTNYGDNLQGPFVRKHTGGTQSVRPHVLNVVNHRYTAK